MAQQTAFGLTSLYDPSIAVDQAALDRQMALAQALRLQSMNPVDTSNRQIGGVAYKVSPLEGVAKIVQALKATQLDQSNDQSRMGLQQKTAAAVLPMMANLFGGDGAMPQAPQSVDGGRPPGVTADALTSGGFPQPPEQSAAPAASPMDAQKAQLKRAAMSAMLMGNTELANKLIANYMEITPEQKNMSAQGIDPQRMGRATVGKAEREAIAPTRLGPAVYASADGVIHGLPQPIPGAVNIPDPSNPSGYRAEQVPGGASAIEAEARAKAGGAAAFDPFQGYDASGNPLPVRSKAAALSGGGAPAPAAPASSRGGPPSVARLDVVEPGKGQLYGTQPLGTEHSQKALDTSFEALKAANREAQNTKSYLQNIQTAAEKGAIVGPGAERREYIQGLLQLAGIKEDVNTNATTQTQLLEKYSSQIVARLGASGGMSTDAARAILQSAYPGQHMNVEAIKEAVSNLNGAQDMTMAKMRFLQEHGIRRDTATYQRREAAFDQAADPRVWQWRGITDPQKRSAFVKEVVKQDPTFAQRVKQLEEMGAL